MESKVEKLKHSRAKISIKANAADLAHAAEHAFHHIADHITVKGFRPGKAPKPMLVAQAGKGRLLSELVDHALPELLMQVAEQEKLPLIEAPHYTLEKLCELNDDGTVKEGATLEFVAEADFAPEMVVGDYTKLKVKAEESDKITDKDVDAVIERIADQRATWKKVDRAAKEGDRVEVDFAGKRNGIPEERMASQNHPVVLGSGSLIPGFEDELIGKKAGDTHTFEITFPKDYHAKDLAGEKATFDVKVHSVEEKELPSIDGAFAKDFGHDTVVELRDAIKQEREFVQAEQAKEATQAKVLDEFLKLIKVDVPQSLVEKELDRQIDTLRQQAAMYGLTFDNYLNHIKKTEEELRTEMRENSEKAVIIGLGLGEVVKREKLADDKNAGYAAIEKLVEIATGGSVQEKKTAKSKKEKEA